MVIHIITDITTASIRGMIRGITHTGMDGTDRGVIVGMVGIRLGMIHGIMEDTMGGITVIMDMVIIITDRIMEDIIHTIQIIQMVVAAAEIAILPDGHLQEVAAEVRQLETIALEGVRHLVLLPKCDPQKAIQAGDPTVMLPIILLQQAEVLM